MLKHFKFIKVISSRVFYLFLGLALSISIYAAYAAWDSTVSSGDPLTATIWNEHVQKLIEIDTAIANMSFTCGKSRSSCNFTAPAAPMCTATCPAGETRTGGGCSSSVGLAVQNMYPVTGTDQYTCRWVPDGSYGTGTFWAEVICCDI